MDFERSNKMSNITTTAKVENKIVLGEFGNGRFSPAMLELFKDSQRLLSFTELQAHVVARQIGVDAGNLLKGQVTLKYGSSVSKTGTMTLKEVTESLKMNATPAMNVGSVCSQLDKARKVGLVVNDCSMDKNIMLWIDDKASELEKTIAAQ